MSNPCKLYREDVTVTPYGLCTACGYKVFDHMTNPSPIQSDEELDLIKRILDQSNLSSFAKEGVLKAVLSHSEQQALRARFDELTKTYTQVVGDKEAPSNRYSKVTRIFNGYLKKRHAELQAQLTNTQKEKE